MSFLPISINITNKKILILGAGKVAARKVKHLLPFTSNITVVAPEISDEMKQFSEVDIIESAYDKKYLEGAFLVYACTDNTEVNDQIICEAEEAGKLCNRVDKGPESHFHSPAIIETEDMVVAVNTKDRDIRKMVAFKNELKEHIDEKIELQKQKVNQKGKVYLVGFGPGNPDLLTKKGEKLLQQADAIFYDDLLDADALSKYPGEKTYVGKRRDNHSKEQSEINDILLKAAQEEKMVVRLKGGDPLIFGRGGEERLYLEKNGVEVEIIPGISSAIAAAAYANIPLTHRGISSSVAFGTAHGKNSYKILESDTSVYYMGAKNIKEIAQKYLDKNYPADYPVGLVHKASLPDQEVIKTNITEIAEGRVEIKSPVISIFGNTVEYERELRKRTE
ncbi:uroporphyrinogen-III C-methyltransferase [Labilibacter sediminis]|nr:uroporphyrinogen-III C-methyltransferase [Labilibacter sediminis]